MENVFSDIHGWLPSYLGPKACRCLMRLPHFECSSYILLAHTKKPVLAETLPTDWLVRVGAFPGLWEPLPLTLLSYCVQVYTDKLVIIFQSVVWQ